MTISFTDRVRATVSMAYRGADIFQNVYHYEAGAGVSATEAAVVAAITAHMVTIYNNLSTIVTDFLVGVQVDFWKRNTGTGKWDAIGIGDFSAWSGGDATDETPSGVAGLVRFFTAGIGRQGRKFIAGLGDDQIDSGVLLGTAITILSNYADQVVLPVAVTGGDMDPGWWSEKDTDIYEMDGSFVVNAIPAYQRRRKQGVGS